MKIIPWFDREELLTLLSKRVQGFLAGYRQNVALLGPESVGKTTLVKRLLSEEASCAPLVKIYLEIQERQSLSEWAAQFTEAVLCGL
ncbi:MAG: hypothetical protein HYZ93_06570, partial [Candidatus Omnitrophica bacterium]|nr:hypothetical protein [Candidatus Omnitrophota bacterium]